MSKVAELYYSDFYGVIKKVMADYPHLYRTTNPDTSRQAAARLTAQRLTQIQREILNYMALYPGGVTDLDIQRNFNDMGSTYRTRRAELVAQGKVKDSGRRMIQMARKRILWQLV